MIPLWDNRRSRSDVQFGGSIARVILDIFRDHQSHSLAYLVNARPYHIKTFDR